MNRRSAIKWILTGSLAIYAGIPGCKGELKPVGDWVVSFATEVGKWVSGKANTFAEAVERAWEAIFPTLINGVHPDRDNPLIGVYEGILTCKIQWGSQANDDTNSNELSVKLDHPRMSRQSESSATWSLAPEEMSKITDLENQLLKK